MQLESCRLVNCLKSQNTNPYFMEYYKNFILDSFGRGHINLNLSSSPETLISSNLIKTSNDE